MILAAASAPDVAWRAAWLFCRRVIVQPVSTFRIML
jgi:hypothetical protein